ncbi:hypothetical protein VTG60DRAFT_5169 [Thermothelomyces hinnuleus]
MATPLSMGLFRGPIKAHFLSIILPLRFTCSIRYLGPWPASSSAPEHFFGEPHRLLFHRTEDHFSCTHISKPLLCFAHCTISIQREWNIKHWALNTERICCRIVCLGSELASPVSSGPKITTQTRHLCVTAHRAVSKLHWEVGNLQATSHPSTSISVLYQSVASFSSVQFV